MRSLENEMINKQKRIFSSKKGDTWISAVLFILIGTLVVVLVLEAVTPVLQNMRDKSVFVRTQDAFLNLNQHIKEVALEGQGSQRVIPVDIQKGAFEVKDNVVKWKMDTEATIVQPRTTVKLGNVLIVGNGDVKAYEEGNSFVLENTNVLFRFNKTGDTHTFVTLNTSKIITQSTLKTGDTQTNATPSYEFFVDGDSTTANGNGYTQLLNKGSDLGKASVLLHVNSSVEYEITFTLEAQSDYLKIDVNAALTNPS